LRDLPHQKIPRELCGGEDPAIFSMSHVPMERFFDGTNQENSKNQERKNGGKKKGFFLFLTYMEGPILMCSPSVGNALSYRLCAILP
jgi:hypothetical protein